MTDTPLSLRSYLDALKGLIDTTAPVWLSCQIRAINTNKSGHYYLELADDDDGKVVATLKGTLWRSKANHVLDKFKQGTQMQLTAGMSVLLYGQASLHPQYGLAFHISDINPTYTVGKLMQDYHDMKQKLSDKGLLTLNKGIAMPFDLYHVAVIAPAQAAGLGDFLTQIDKLSPLCHFSYHYATFQGNNAGDELRQALLQATQKLPDLVVIIRGGGAVGDLAYLNDYELAAMIAECAVPVWTGIGHQRDRTLLDDVAHRCFDTPSKVAAAIEGHIISVWQQAKAYLQTINSHATITVLANTQNQQALINSVATKARRTLNSQRHLLTIQLAHIESASKQFLSNKQNTLTRHLHSQKIALYHLNDAKQQLHYLQNTVLFYRPQSILARGYATVHHQTTPIKKRKQTQVGQTLTLTFADGEVLVQVVAV